MIKNVDIRQATAEDIKLFYPNGSPYTCYAFLASYQGKPAALAGLIIKRTGAVIFSDMLPHGASKRTAWLAIKELYGRIVQLDIPFYTAVEGCEERSKMLFKHLGMQYLTKMDGLEYFVCS